MLKYKQVLISVLVLEKKRERKIMAINQVYAIYDVASECYLNFMCFQNDKIADMTFRKAFKEQSLRLPLLYEYPNSFKVMNIGTFDDNTGLFENTSPSRLLLEFGSLSAS